MHTPTPPPRTSLPAILALLAALALSGCGTAGVKSSSSQDERALHIKADAPQPAGRSVELVYVLGHNQHRFVAVASEAGATAQASEDHQVLEETKLDPKRYNEFFDKALAFVKAPHRNVASSADPERLCRNTFTVL